jgi:hypothetical protein
MTTFPHKLSPFHFGNTYVDPTIEFASRTRCIARTRFMPKNYAYETVVTLKNGEWSAKTDGGDLQTYYAEALAAVIALRVINWWEQTYMTMSATLPPVTARARASWTTRAAHKLLTEVPLGPDQIAVLHVLAANYGLPLLRAAPAPSLRGAEWATAANRHLEREIPEPFRQGAVELLVVLITGGPCPDLDAPTAAAA